MSGFLFETKEEGIMEQLSRVQLYRSLSQKGISENFSDVLQINMVILDGVENWFLTSDEGVESGYIDIYQVIQITRENLERLWNENYSVDRKQIEKLQERIRKVLLSFESKENSNKTARNLFNKILNELSTFNEDNLLEEFWVEKRDKKEGMPQVFLSHAYDDKAYAVALYDYFYSNGIFLYVGWMQNGDIKDGIKLKEKLHEELDSSNQLLFLRTANSELDIQGKHFLRPSCSWELGNFYRKENGDEKYMINLYSIDEYRNSQVHGLRLFTGISGQRMQGNKIRYKEKK